MRLLAAVLVCSVVSVQLPHCKWIYGSVIKLTLTQIWNMKKVNQPANGSVDPSIMFNFNVWTKHEKYMKIEWVKKWMEN